MSPFEVLGLPNDATLADVYAARRQLAKQFHPDTHAAQEAQVSMATINNAVRIIEQQQLAEPVVDVAQPLLGYDIISDDTTANFRIEGGLDQVFEAMWIVASWLGDPYDADSPNEFMMIVHDPSDCFCKVSCKAEGDIVEVQLQLTPRLSSTTPPPSLLAQKFAAELDVLEEG